ncbi:AAA family ATPase [Streptosporangiaceae bacterium NEAU-GS5]|nr:AAA family ATPase [Streptosporangiaceae bacterium NEAU-GS5]
MWSHAPGSELRGRNTECATLDRLVARARSGVGQVLVLRGETGIGKSALLGHLSEHACGCRVARAAGVESETELAYAGLHQLCAPMLDHLDRLPLPQRDALATAFGTRNGAPPDPFLVGLAVLTLLAEIAEKQPLICLIDDAQWLDQASARTLAFAARRLLAEPIALVLAGGMTEDHLLDGLPELVVTGLGDPDARAVLDDALQGPLDEAVRDQIVAESRGNPLALVELPRAWSPAELAGGFGLPGTPLTGRIEQIYRHRLDGLPAETRRLLLTAAAEPTGGLALLWRAMEALEIGVDAAAPAEAAGLIELGTRVRFPHPLVRSTVYGSAPPADRRVVHRALAEATDQDLDPDRHAWHRARATSGADEQVAAELERSADRARARGGLAAAAALLERAAAFSADPPGLARRALAAAQAKHQAGAPDDAIALLALAHAGPLDDIRGAHAELLHGRLAAGSSHGRDAPALLLAAARRLEPLDAALSRETYLEALVAALSVGRLGNEASLQEVAAAARAAPHCEKRPSDLLLAGLAEMVTEGYAAGAPLLKRAVAAFRTDETGPDEAVHRLWPAAHAARDLWDDEGWDALCARQIQLARQAGALAVLPEALSAHITLHLFKGELRRAASVVQELAAVTEATGDRLPPYGALALAAYQGRQAAAAELVDVVGDAAARRGEGTGLTRVQHCVAVLHNGLGHYEDAFAAAEDGAAGPHEPAFAAWSLAELVEAAARSGRDERAADAFERLAVTTDAAGTAWARGVESRSRALISPDSAAERHYRAAIKQLGRASVRLELARAHLLYGEWLRRANRRFDARTRLQAAYDMFAEMGAEGFAERARREVLATGGTVRKRSVDADEELTAQEAQIAQLARDGLSNPEIGGQLFISARTVEWHLRKVFTKLGITSRRQLRAALPPNGRFGAAED